MHTERGARSFGTVLQQRPGTHSPFAHPKTQFHSAGI